MSVTIPFQEELVEKVQKMTLDSCPRTVLLAGSSGSGRHALSELAGDVFSVEVEEVTDNINLASVGLVERSGVPRIYVIDLDRLSEREQNIILKLVEEPPAGARLFLLCTEINTILPTIVGRCQIWKFNTPTEEQLKTLTSDPNVLRISKTAGDVRKYSEIGQKLSEIYALCNKIFLHVGNANFSNILTIGNKVDFEGKGEKYDVECFFRTLKAACMDIMMKDSNPTMQQAYNLTSELLQSSSIPHINTQWLFENYLCNLKLLLRKA